MCRVAFIASLILIIVSFTMMHYHIYCIIYSHVLCLLYEHSMISRILSCLPWVPGGEGRAAGFRMQEDPGGCCQPPAGPVWACPVSHRSWPPASLTRRPRRPRGAGRGATWLTHPASPQAHPRGEEGHVRGRRRRGMGAGVGG